MSRKSFKEKVVDAYHVVKSRFVKQPPPAALTQPLLQHREVNDYDILLHLREEDAVKLPRFSVLRKRITVTDIRLCCFYRLMIIVNSTARIDWVLLETDFEANAVESSGFAISFALFFLQSVNCFAHLRFEDIIMHDKLLFPFVRLIVLIKQRPRVKAMPEEWTDLRQWFLMQTDLGTKTTHMAPFTYDPSIPVDDRSNRVDVLAKEAGLVQGYGIDNCMLLLASKCTKSPTQLRAVLEKKQHSRVVLAHWMYLLAKVQPSRQDQEDTQGALEWLVSFSETGCACAH
jgi:hypothetical protein